MRHLGDFDASTVIYGKFTTFRPSTGAAFTLGGTPALSVYKDNSATQSTTGVTLTADFDSVTGLNHFAIDTSADGAFYAAGSFFDIVITTGTVDSVSVVGTVVGSFTLRRNSALKPTTAGRTLDVTAGGEAGIDWANVGSPTTTLNLSGTTIKTATDVETDTADIQTRLPAALGANGNMRADVRDYNGTAGTFASGRPEVNTSHWAGSSLGTMTGAYPALGVVDSGTAQAVTSTSMTLRAGFSSSGDGSIVGATVFLPSNGITGDITAYNNTTKVATVTWSFVPTGTPVYVVFASSTSSDLTSIDSNLSALISTVGTAGAGLTEIPWNAAWDAEVQSECTDALEATVADSVPADGSRPSIAQAAYMLVQLLTEQSKSGTTVTIKKPNGVTTLFTLTLDSATTPTSVTRAS